MATASEDAFCLMEDRTIAIESGWVFFCNSKEFVETGIPLAALTGNGPIYVDRRGGSRTSRAQFRGKRQLKVSRKPRWRCSTKDLFTRRWGLPRDRYLGNNAQWQSFTTTCATSRSATRTFPSISRRLDLGRFSAGLNRSGVFRRPFSDSRSVLAKEACRRAERFGVSVASAIRWRQLVLARGPPAAKPQGGDRRTPTIEDHAAFILAATEQQPDRTLAELRGVSVSIATLGRFFARHGITRKNDRPRDGAGSSRRPETPRRVVRGPARSRPRQAGFQ